MKSFIFLEEGLCMTTIWEFIQEECSPVTAFYYLLFLWFSCPHFFPPQKLHRNQKPFENGTTLLFILHFLTQNFQLRKIDKFVWKKLKIDTHYFIKWKKQRTIFSYKALMNFSKKCSVIIKNSFSMWFLKTWRKNLTLIKESSSFI